MSLRIGIQFATLARSTDHSCSASNLMNFHAASGCGQLDEMDDAVTVASVGRVGAFAAARGDEHLALHRRVVAIDLRDRPVGVAHRGDLALREKVGLLEVVRGGRRGRRDARLRESEVGLDRLEALRVFRERRFGHVGVERFAAIGPDPHQQHARRGVGLAAQHGGRPLVAAGKLLRPARYSSQVSAASPDRAPGLGHQVAVVDLRVGAAPDRQRRRAGPSTRRRSACPSLHARRKSAAPRSRTCRAA